MSKCKGCGKRIVWGETPEGKKIPLDPSAPVYSIDVGENSGEMRVWDGLGVRPVERRRGFMVSHFATCPDANRFSGSKRK